MKPLKILFLSTEVAPFAKAGGLADVSGSLPKALREMGHDVKVIMPRHGCINEKRFKLEVAWENIETPVDGQTERFGIKKADMLKDLPVYFVDKYNFFGGRKKVYSYEDENKRFMFFDFAVFKVVELLDWKPDIIHCNDWTTGLVPYLLRTKFLHHPKFKKTASVYTIHNLAFQQGNSPLFDHNSPYYHGNSKLPEFSDEKGIASINFMKKGIIHSEIINTVSENYAKEILTKDHGAGLHRLLKDKKYKLFGVLNGVDYKIFNPALDKDINVNYDARSWDKKALNKKALQKEFGLTQNPDIPIIGIAARITEQKGFDLLYPLLDILARQNLQIVLVGEGNKKYYKYFRRAQKKYPEKYGVHLEFSTEIASRIYAGSDMFLMPSRFEPCGLGQLISLRYGSVPIVRKTGGLTDTIKEIDIQKKTGNGFTFTRYDKMDLFATIIKAVSCYRFRDTWKSIAKRGMKETFSWKIPAENYTRIYNKAIKRKKEIFGNGKTL